MSDNPFAKTPNRGCQFSLLGLFLLVTVIACLIGITLLVGELSGVGKVEALTIVFGRQFSQSPVLIVWLVGTVVVLRRWDQHPVVSKFALSAMGGLFLLSILTSYFQVWIMSSRVGWSPVAKGVVMSVYSFVYTCLAAVCWGLILAAVLMHRGQRPGQIDAAEAKD